MLHDPITRNDLYFLFGGVGNSESWVEQFDKEKMIFYFEAASINSQFKLNTVLRILSNAEKINISTYYEDYIRCEVVCNNESNRSR